MKILTRSAEEHQYMKDLAYIWAEKDFLNTQEFLEEMDRERKPARIVVMDRSPIIEEIDEL